MAPVLAMTRSIGRLFGRGVCAGTLILVLGFLAVKAGKEGLSNFFVQSAHLEIERWSQPGQRLRGDEGMRVMQYLTKSLHYSPNNPWSLEEMGTFQLRGMSAATDARLAVAAARSANVDFRMALMQRPTSPFTWANFALSKLYLDEQDDELFQALGRAEELGPWEPEVQQTVAFVGLAVWNRLNPAQQAMVVRAMQRGAQRNPGNIAEIAKTFDRIDLFCGLSYSGSQGREACNPISKSESGKKPNRQ
jgi:hypothetical protein